VEIMPRKPIGETAMTDAEFGYPVLPSTDAAADRRVDEAGVLTFGLSVSGHGLSTVT
jgi:hypothetical protein